jgi:hypothetical protein
METDEHGRAHKRKVASAVASRFPQFEFAIHELMDRRESFRDMGEELLEAELALSNVDNEPPDLREARTAEWQACIDRSLAELEEELRKYSVSAEPGVSSRPAR